MCRDIKVFDWMHGKSHFDRRAKRLMAMTDSAARIILDFWTSILKVVYETYKCGGYLPKSGQSFSLDEDDFLFESDQGAGILPPLPVQRQPLTAKVAQQDLHTICQSTEACPAPKARNAIRQICVL